MVGALARAAFIERLRLAPGIDDAEHLLVWQKCLRERIEVGFSVHLQRDPLKLPVQIVRRVHDLPDGQTGREIRFERGLGRGAEHGGRVIVDGQFSDGLHAGLEIGQGKHLRFVKNDDALCQIVQLAAFGRAVGEQGFKKLHVCGHDDRRVPVFRRQPHPFGKGCPLGVRAAVHTRVVLEHVLRAQNLAEFVRRLFDDAGVRNDINDPLLSVATRMLQRERQRRKGLAAAGRDGQCEQAGCLSGGCAALGQNFMPPAADFACGRIEICQRPLEPRLQRIQIVELSAHGRVGRHERFGIQKIRVDQTGIEHPDEERLLEAGLAEGLHDRSRRLRRVDLLRKRAVISGLPLDAAKEGGFAVRIGAAALIGQTGVMSGDAEGGLRTAQTDTFLAACCRMIDPSSVSGQVSLKFTGVFPDIMQQSGLIGQRVGCKRCGEGCGLFRRSRVVRDERLHAPVLGAVCQIIHNGLL